MSRDRAFGPTISERRPAAVGFENPFATIRLSGSIALQKIQIACVFGLNVRYKRSSNPMDAGANKCRSTFSGIEKNSGSCGLAPTPCRGAAVCLRPATPLLLFQAKKKAKLSGKEPAKPMRFMPKCTLFFTCSPLFL